MPDPDISLWEKNSKEFYEYWDFPNCIGALDEKHIHIEAAENDGSLFYNYKGSHSIVFLALCDATYCYSVLNIGAYGKQNHSTVFSQSKFGSSIKNDTLLLPADKCLPKTNITMSHVFVADEAFPLKRHLMRPYPRKELNIIKRAFNYRLSRARRIVENVFGITASRWRIL